MTAFRSTFAAAGLALAVAISLSPSVSAHEGTDHTKPAPGAAAGGKPAPAATELRAEGTHDARAYFTDTELLDQDGRKLRFYSDVLKDKVVLINVIYTSCKDACPLITRQLTEVRDRIGDSFGKQVVFISLSSDPERDTPAALRVFAAKNNANTPGWIFLTGKKANMDTVLSRLGQLGQSAEDHSTLLIAGNVPAKRWSKIRPNAPTAAIADRLNLLADASQAPSRTGH